MSKKDITLYRGNSLPELSRSALETLPDLPSSSGAHLFDSFRTPATIVRRDTDLVNAHTDYLDARINQLRKANILIDERISVASKIADMENCLIEIQREKDHERWKNESARNAEKTEMAYNHRIAVTRKEAELARAQEAHIRAVRNRDAAERVAPLEADKWYAEAEARRHNAYAERQDAATDLARGSLPANNPAAAADAAARQREDDIAAIEHQIELERQRGNLAAVMALTTLRARLRAA